MRSRINIEFDLECNGDGEIRFDSLRDAVRQAHYGTPPLDSGVEVVVRVRSLYRPTLPGPGAALVVAWEEDV